jgi:hypothetical protein
LDISLFWLLADNELPLLSSPLLPLLFSLRRTHRKVLCADYGDWTNVSVPAEWQGLRIHHWFSPTGAVGLSPLMKWNCNLNWLLVMSCSVHRALFWIILIRRQTEEIHLNRKWLTVLFQ